MALRRKTTTVPCLRNKKFQVKVGNTSSFLRNTGVTSWNAVRLIHTRAFPTELYTSVNITYNNISAGQAQQVFL